mmetsp:Transcript_46961/g.111859  ORF Transcript_46961/g.111859 Transcript_46961/m.111859 type:complete len:282 (-) Transcript_46961:418-1263(-)
MILDDSSPPPAPPPFWKDVPPITMLPSSSHPPLPAWCQGTSVPCRSYDSSRDSSSQTEMERLLKASSCRSPMSFFSRPKSSDATFSDSAAIMLIFCRNLSSTLPYFSIMSRSAFTNFLPETDWIFESVPSGMIIFSFGRKASVMSVSRASTSSVRSSWRMRRISSGSEESLYSSAFSLSIVITCAAGSAPAFRAWSMLASRRRTTLSSRPPLALRSMSCFFMPSGVPPLSTFCSAAEAFEIRSLMHPWMAPLRRLSLLCLSPSASWILSVSLSRKRMSMRS